MHRSFLRRWEVTKGAACAQTGRWEIASCDCRKECIRGVEGGKLSRASLQWVLDARLRKGLDLIRDV